MWKNETLNAEVVDVLDGDIGDEGLGGSRLGLRDRLPLVHLEGRVDVASKLGYLRDRREEFADGGVNVAKLLELVVGQLRAQERGQAGLDAVELVHRTFFVEVVVVDVNLGGDDGLGV